MQGFLTNKDRSHEAITITCQNVISGDHLVSPRQTSLTLVPLITTAQCSHSMFAFPYLIPFVLLLRPQLSFCLWPIPRSLQSGSTPLKLSTNFNINVDISNAPKDLLAAVARSKSHIHNDKHHRLVVGHETSDQFAIVRANTLSTLSITLEKGAHVRKIAEESVQEIGTRVESYHLTVPSDGSPATLTANSTLGLFRGLTTFEQLWYDLEGTIYTLEAPLEIYDSPAFVSSYYSTILCSTNDKTYSLTAGSCLIQHGTCT
jgi:hypothetical protein